MKPRGLKVHLKSLTLLRTVPKEMLGKQSPWLWSMNYKWISKQISHPPSRHDTREIGNLLPSCLRKILNIWAADRCEGVIPSVGRFRWKLHILEFLWRFSTIFPSKPLVHILMRFRILKKNADRGCTIITFRVWQLFPVITTVTTRIVSLYLCCGVCFLSTAKYCPICEVDDIQLLMILCGEIIGRYDLYHVSSRHVAPHDWRRSQWSLIGACFTMPSASCKKKKTFATSTFIQRQSKGVRFWDQNPLHHRPLSGSMRNTPVNFQKAKKNCRVENLDYILIDSSRIYKFCSFASAALFLLVQSREARDFPSIFMSILFALLVCTFLEAAKQGLHSSM